MRQLQGKLAHLNLDPDSAIADTDAAAGTDDCDNTDNTDNADNTDNTGKSERSDPQRGPRVERLHRHHHKRSRRGRVGPNTNRLEDKRRRCIFYDLETSIVSRGKHVPPGMPFRVLSTAVDASRVSTTLQPGMRRNLIVEIGAVDVDCFGHRTTFHRLVDPRLEHLTLRETFEVTGQCAKATLRFWQKLFYEKDMLVPLPRDALLDERMAVFDELFDQPQFVAPGKALSHFVTWVYGEDGADADPLLIAHNGSSFDAPILRAHLHRCKIPPLDRGWMVDSIPVIKRAVPRLKSYALGVLHHKLVGVPFRAHHASVDALALLRVCQAVATIEGVRLDSLWSETNPPLTAIKGIGPKTSKTLRDCGVEDTHALVELVRGNMQCPLKCLRHVWKSLRRKYGRKGTTLRVERSSRSGWRSASSSDVRSKSV